MRVVFLGFQTWGLVTLKAVLDSGHEVLATITHPESDKEHELSFNDSVKDFSEQQKIPTFQKSNITPEITKEIDSLSPDLLITSNWRRHVNTELIACSKFGAINIHRSFLPKYGGLAPINWAIVNGETETGVTIHTLDEKIDLGDILMQEKIPIDFTETATDVFYKTNPVISRMIPEVLNQIENGTVTPIQQDPSLATFFHKRLIRDNLIDWNRSNVEIYNLIRAQSDPFFNAFTFYNGQILKIKSASLASAKYRGTPGRVVTRVEDGVVVLCGKRPNTSDVTGQGIVIHEVQLKNSQPMKANAFFPRMGIYLENTSSSLTF